MIAVTGAVIVFSALPGARAGNSRCLAAGVRRKTIRAGLLLALVGPQRIRSQSRRSVSSCTGLASHALNVRPFRKRRSRTSSFAAISPSLSAGPSLSVANSGGWLRVSRREPAALSSRVQQLAKLPEELVLGERLLDERARRAGRCPLVENVFAVA